MKKRILSLITIAVLSTNAHAIWVHDSTAAVNAGKQILETKKQLEQMKAQVEQMKATYNSLNGTRGIVNLLQDPVIISKLPKSYQELYSGIKDSKSGKWADLYKLSEDGKSAPNASHENIKKAYDNLLDDYNQKMSGVFDAATQRIKNLEKFTNQISTTKDPKEIADLQARISAEQVGINIDNAKLNMLKEVQALKKEALQQQASNKYRENLAKDFDTPNFVFKKPFSH